MAEVIVALDTRTADEALGLVDELGSPAKYFKVGLELFTRGGPAVVHALRERGKRVFLDLKLHDIPNTVAGAVKAASALEVDLLTLHVSGGRAMMEAAREAAEAVPGTPPRLLGVTVLTSLDRGQLARIWGRSTDDADGGVEEDVVRLAELARGSGLDGVVASPQEARALRRAFPQPFLLVTPGIRPAGRAPDDQRRTATPGEAVEAGADFLVVGRAVTGTRDPAPSFQAILSQVRRAHSTSPEAGVP